MTKAEKENSLAIPGQESIPEEPEPEPTAAAVRITHIVPNSSVIHFYHYAGIIGRRGSMISSASDVLRRVYTRPTTRTIHDDHGFIFSSSLFALLLSQLMALPWLYHRTLALLFHPLLLVPPTLLHRPSPPTPPLLEDVQTLFTTLSLFFLYFSATPVSLVPLSTIASPPGHMDVPVFPSFRVSTLAFTTLLSYDEPFCISPCTFPCTVHNHN